VSSSLLMQPPWKGAGCSKLQQQQGSQPSSNSHSAGRALLLQLAVWPPATSWGAATRVSSSSLLADTATRGGGVLVAARSSSRQQPRSKLQPAASQPQSLLASSSAVQAGSKGHQPARACPYPQPANQANPLTTLWLSCFLMLLLLMEASMLSLSQARPRLLAHHQDQHFIPCPTLSLANLGESIPSISMVVSFLFTI